MSLRLRASGSPNQDIITVRHGNGFQSKIVGSHSDGNFAISLETDKRHVNIDLSPSTPSLSARLLWTVLDVLTEGQYPRLWRATSVGSVSASRQSNARSRFRRDYGGHSPFGGSTTQLCVWEAGRGREALNSEIGVSQTTNLKTSAKIFVARTARRILEIANIDPELIKAMIRKPRTVHGGPRARRWPWPRRRHFDQREKRAVVRVSTVQIRKGGAIIYGSVEERAYCQAFADYLGGGYADAVNSGTNAVDVALRALDLEPGSEVIVPPIN